jgi:hypothetical protein
MKSLPDNPNGRLPKHLESAAAIEDLGTKKRKRRKSRIEKTASNRDGRDSGGSN